MRKSIWKYDLETTAVQYIPLPLGSEILTVQVQGNTPRLWAIVDPDEKTIERKCIETFGTGHFIDEKYDEEKSYISTYQLHGGELVFHVFETKFDNK